MENVHTCQSIKDRIIFFLNYIEEPISRAEKKCGFSCAYLRKLKANPSYDKLETFLNEYPQLSRSWLLSGEGEMMSDAVEDIPITAEDSDINPPEVPTEEAPKDYIPLLPSVAHGGRLSDFSQSVSRHESLGKLFTLLDMYILCVSSIFCLHISADFQHKTKVWQRKCTD